MTAVLREAWLWLLLAFILGLVIGYFLRRYTIGDDPAETAEQPATEESAAVQDDGVADSEPAEVDEPEADDAPDAAEPEPEPVPAKASADRDPDAAETATVTLAELSTSAPSPAEPAPEEDADADASADEVEELREGPHFDESVHAEQVDTGNVYMPVVEPLRVPHGRREAQAHSATSAPEPDTTDAESVEPSRDDIAAVIDEESAEAVVRDAEKGKPKRRSRRSS